MAEAAMAQGANPRGSTEARIRARRFRPCPRDSPWLFGARVASEVKLPRLGQGMEAGTIVKWLKSEGDKVEKGEPLYELDTDKVTQEVEADFSGTLLKIALESGKAPVGETIAWIGDEGEQVADATK